MTAVSQRLSAPVAAGLIVSAVFNDAVALPGRFQPPHRAVQVLA